MPRLVLVYTDFRQPIRSIQTLLQMGVALDNMVLIRLQTMNIHLLNYLGGNQIEKIYKRRSWVYQREIKWIAAGVQQLVRDDEMLEKSNTELKEQDSLLSTVFTSPTIYLVCPETCLQRTLKAQSPDLVVIDRELYKKLSIEKFNVLICA